MKATIFCRPTDKGIHTFYLNANGTEYYLFHQNYRKGVSEYYRNGVSINEAINFGRSKKDDALMRTMQKLPMYLKYAEKEYGIQVLNQTIMISYFISLKNMDLIKYQMILMNCA